MTGLADTGPASAARGRTVECLVGAPGRAGTVLVVTDAELEQLGINVIRGLAMDAPQKANSGHPGTAMALAPLAHVLFTRIMRHDPDRPRLARPRPLHPVQRPRLDPAVLHALPHRLRAHPRRPQAVPAVGQQDAGASRGPPHRRGRGDHRARSARESATASAWASPSAGCGPRFGPELVDHHTFVICGDGDLEEGISHEAASLAGHLGLGRLVYVYDDNHITIDGPTELAYTDDVAERFDAYGWHTENIGEVANDTDALEAALRRAMAVEDKPSMIVLRSHIGWPVAAQDRHRRRPTGARSARTRSATTKEILGLPPDEPFWVPDEVLDFYRRCVGARRGARGRRGRPRFDAWTGDKAGLGRLPARPRAWRGGTQKLPDLRGRHRSWPPGGPSTHCINATADADPGADGRIGRPDRATPACKLDDAVDPVRRAPRRRARSTSGSGSTPWARP